jgi:integrase/recombinase XerC
MHADSARVIQSWLTYCQASGMSAGTIKVKRHYLENLAAQVDLLAATETDLIDYMNNAGWMAQTRKSARSQVRSFYSWAHRMGLVETNPAQYLPVIKVPQGKPKPASDDALERALDGASVTLRAMLLLAAYAGLRRNEIASLRVKDVLSDRLRVTGKGGRTRVVPLHPVLKEALDAQIEIVRPSFYVFPGKNPGDHIGAHYVWKHIRNATGGTPPHELRHRFATKSYAVGRDIRAVQELLGHSSPTTTARYVQVDDDAMVAAVMGVATITPPPPRGWGAGLDTSQAWA